MIYKTTAVGLEVVELSNGTLWVSQASYARFVGKCKSTIKTRCTKLIEPRKTIDIYNEAHINSLGSEPILNTIIKHPNGRYYKVCLINWQIFSKWLLIDKPELLDEILEVNINNYLKNLIVLSDIVETSK